RERRRARSPRPAQGEPPGHRLCGAQGAGPERLRGRPRDEVDADGAHARRATRALRGGARDRGVRARALPLVGLLVQAAHLRRQGIDPARRHRLPGGVIMNRSKLIALGLGAAAALSLGVASSRRTPPAADPPATTTSVAGGSERGLAPDPWTDGGST